MHLVDAVLAAVWADANLGHAYLHDPMPEYVAHHVRPDHERGLHDEQHFGAQDAARGLQAVQLREPLDTLAQDVFLRAHLASLLGGHALRLHVGAHKASGPDSGTARWQHSLQR